MTQSPPPSPTLGHEGHHPQKRIAGTVQPAEAEGGTAARSTWFVCAGTGCGRRRQIVPGRLCGSTRSGLWVGARQRCRNARGNAVFRERYPDEPAVTNSPGACGRWGSTHAAGLGLLGTWNLRGGPARPEDALSRTEAVQLPEQPPPPSKPPTCTSLEPGVMALLAPGAVKLGTAPESAHLGCRDCLLRECYPGPNLLLLNHWTRRPRSCR